MSYQDEKDALNAIVAITEATQEQSYASMAKFFDGLFSAFSFKLKNNPRPEEEIGSDYAGIHINQQYEESDFLRMIESFRNGQNLHAKYALQILEDAIKIYQSYPNISMCNMKNSKSKLGVVVVGDMHGSFKDLYYIITKYGIPGKNFRFVFNGDFVDRGPQQSECVLTLLYAFLLYPTRVFLNRGNHEDLSININNHFSPNFKQDVDAKFGKFSMTVFNQAQRLFRRLPLATVIENNGGFRCFITHGGISDRLDLNYIAGPTFNRFQFDSINVNPNDHPEKKKMAEQLSDLLWSDPGSSSLGCIPNNHRGIGYIFGSDVSANFCKRYGFNAIIRSHEVRQQGVTRDHPYCFTIFSSSHYCGGNNLAAVLFIDADQPGIKMHQFSASPLSMDDFDREKRLLIQSFKEYLEGESSEIMSKFKKVDKNRTGSIDINVWASILAEHIVDKHGISVDPKHFITLKDYLCPCNDGEQTAQYVSMFTAITSEKANQLLEFLSTLFSLIDIDRNGWISRSEAKEAVRLMNKNMGTHYASSFIDQMDLNKDGKVDLNEFTNAFRQAYSL